jgi:hypothetical protein
VKLIYSLKNVPVGKARFYLCLCILEGCVSLSVLSEQDCSSAERVWIQFISYRTSLNATFKTEVIRNRSKLPLAIALSEMGRGLKRQCK